MANLTVPQLKLLDAAVRLDLGDSGLLSIVATMRDNAVAMSAQVPAAEAAIHLGRIQAWQQFHTYLLSIPARLNAITEAESKPTR